MFSSIVDLFDGLNIGKVLLPDCIVIDFWILMELLFIHSRRDNCLRNRSIYWFLVRTSVSMELLFIVWDWLGSNFCSLDVSGFRRRRNKDSFTSIESDCALGRRLGGISGFKWLVDYYSLLLDDEGRRLVLGRKGLRRKGLNRLSWRVPCDFSNFSCDDISFLRLFGLEIVNVLFLKLLQVQDFVLIGP